MLIVPALDRVCRSTDVIRFSNVGPKLFDEHEVIEAFGDIQLNDVQVMVATGTMPITQITTSGHTMHLVISSISRCSCMLGQTIPDRYAS